MGAPHHRDEYCTAHPDALIRKEVREEWGRSVPGGTRKDPKQHVVYRCNKCGRLLEPDPTDLEATS